MTAHNEYKVIFKSTFLFGFVQIFNIAVKAIINKVAAITIGTQGVGLIAIYTSSIGILKTSAGLGISQSAVRDISVANETNEIEFFSKTIITTNRLIILTSTLGFFITVILSPLLSKWTFGNDVYLISFVLIAFAVAFTIMLEGQLAILKGMRQLRLLAKANIFGSTLGLAVAIPSYLIFNENGIIPVLIITPLCALIITNYYVRKINYTRIKISKIELFKISFPMIKIGTALSITTILSQLSTFLISIFIISESDMQHLGLYNAGILIMTGYFSVVINALTTDYYPRISAINNDNNKLKSELNKQSIVSLVLCLPLIVLFLFLLPNIINLLFSEEFQSINDFVRIGIFGTLITICSNQIDLILVAKNKAKLYIVISICYRIIEITLSITLYKYYGLVGMGISMVLMSLFHLFIMLFVVRKLYLIDFEKSFIKIALIVLFFIIAASYFSLINNDFVKYTSGFLFFMASGIFSYFYTKNHLGINLLKINN